MTRILNETARLEQAQDKAPRESLAKIEQETRRALEILDAFAMLSSRRPLHRERTDLLATAEEAILALGLAEQPEIAIERECRGDPWTPVNPAQMRQIFMNLLQNAREAMPRGGILKLALARKAKVWVMFTF